MSSKTVTIILLCIDISVLAMDCLPGQSTVEKSDCFQDVTSEKNTISMLQQLRLEDLSVKIMQVEDGCQLNISWLFHLNSSGAQIKGFQVKLQNHYMVDDFDFYFRNACYIVETIRQDANTAINPCALQKYSISHVKVPRNIVRVNVSVLIMSPDNNIYAVEPSLTARILCAETGTTGYATGKSHIYGPIVGIIIGLCFVIAVYCSVSTEKRKRKIERRRSETIHALQRRRTEMLGATRYEKAENPFDALRTTTTKLQIVENESF